MPMIEYKNVVLNIEYKEEIKDKVDAEQHVHAVNKVSDLTDIVARVVRK